ncbi:hypothetical protein SYNPS1DRAFT_21834, partial [Syncephalis pseudoplumigaleata]
MTANPRSTSKQNLPATGANGHTTARTSYHSAMACAPARDSSLVSDVADSVYILPMSPGSERSHFSGDTLSFWKEAAPTDTGRPLSLDQHHPAQDAVRQSVAPQEAAPDASEAMDRDRCWISDDEARHAPGYASMPRYASVHSSTSYRSSSSGSRKTVLPSLAQISLSALDSDSESMFSGSAWSGFSGDAASKAGSILDADRHTPRPSLRTLIHAEMALDLQASVSALDRNIQLLQASLQHQTDGEQARDMPAPLDTSRLMAQPNNTIISDYDDRDLSGISPRTPWGTSPPKGGDYSCTDQSFITDDSLVPKTPGLSRSTTRSSGATSADSTHDSLNSSMELLASRHRRTTTPMTIKESRSAAVAALYPLRSVAEMENMSIFQAFIKDRHNYIFGGVKKLAIFHSFFVKDLTDAVQKFATSGTLKAIASAFNAHMPGFRYYLHYIHVYSNVITTLEHLQSQYTPFRKMLAKCQSKIVDRNLYQMLFDIMDHMPSYYKCLANILDLYPPNDPEYAKFRDCVQKIEKTTHESTRLARRTRQKEHTKQVQHSLDGLGEMIVTPHRRLIYQSNLHNFVHGFKEAKTRICFLFNDMLLVAKNKGNGRRNFKYRIHLSHVTACVLPDHELANGF